MFTRTKTLENPLYVYPCLMQEERVVPRRLGCNLWRRLAALLASDPLEGVRREDDRRRTAGDRPVAILPG